MVEAGVLYFQSIKPIIQILHNYQTWLFRIFCNVIWNFRLIQPYGCKIGKHQQARKSTADTMK